jgi:carboxymethylenebutenolidase
MKRIALLVTVLALSATTLAQQPTYTAPKNDKVPAADPHVADVLKDSPRHGEWVDVKMADGKPLKAWIVYPMKAGKAGVVIVIHENRGINDWTRAVADQVARDGFIGIAPDLLSGMGPDGGGTDSIGTAGIAQAIAAMTPPLRIERLNAVMAFGKTIPSSNGKTGVVGFCWGGGTSLLYAMAQPGLNASVLYYGPAPTLPGTQTPDLSGLAAVKAPILGLYPSTDPRTAGSAEPISAEMKKLGKFYEYHIYNGATHGFMHQRSEPDTQAAVESWPLVVAFFAKNLK